MPQGDAPSDAWSYDKYLWERFPEYLIIPFGVVGGTSNGDLEERNGEGSIANLEKDVDEHSKKATRFLK